MTTRDDRPELHIVQPRSGTGSTAAPRPLSGESIDRALVRAALSGSRTAWLELVDRHLADVWSWSVEATDTPEDGELVNRLVWLRLAQSLPWVVVDPLESWLRRAVQEEAARTRRSAQRRPLLRAVSGDQEATRHRG